MSIELGFVLYAALFRVAVILSGTVAIYLGYRLFQISNGGGSTDARVKGGNFELSLKNAAPGTVFAMFGAFIIGLMLWQGSPELVIEELESLSERKQDATSEKTAPSKRIVKLKGADQTDIDAFYSLFEEGNADQRDGDAQSALGKYQKALTISGITIAMAAPVFNEIAWIQQVNGNVDAALPLARVAISLEADNAAFQHTLATVFLKKGAVQEALAASRRAVVLTPSADNHEILAKALEVSGDIEGALENMKIAARKNPAFEKELAAMEERNP